jgi:hypothetical protein
MSNKIFGMNPRVGAPSAKGGDILFEQNAQRLVQLSLNAMRIFLNLPTMVFRSAIRKLDEVTVIHSFNLYTKVVFETIN